MSKARLVLCQILKQADKGRWFGLDEIEAIAKVYDVTMAELKREVRAYKDLLK